MSFDLDGRTREFLNDSEAELFREYAAIIRRLRAPDGCPWDRKQTLSTLRRFIVEESFEVLAAINDHLEHQAPLQEIGEEIGDVLLVSMLLADALFHVQGPGLEEILQHNGEKLIRRHPHVFGDTQVQDEHEVKANWDQIKQQVENKEDSVSAVSSGLPPMERAWQIQKKAARVGFDWEDEEPVFEKIQEEILELKEEIALARSGNEKLRDNARIEAELGDLLFSVINLSRKLDADPSVSLARTNSRFVSRFSKIESVLAANGQSVSDVSLATLDKLWDEAKQTEKEQTET